MQHSGRAESTESDLSLVVADDLVPSPVGLVPALAANRLSKDFETDLLETDKRPFARHREVNDDPSCLAAVEEEMPPIAHPIGRVPGGHLAPRVLGPIRRSLEDSPSLKRFEYHLQIWILAHGVSTRPPKSGTLCPHLEGVGWGSSHLEFDDDRLHQAESVVFSAAMRNRVTASLHTSSI